MWGFISERNWKTNCMWLQELYHELDALDKLEQDFQRKCEEEDQRGNCKVSPMGHGIICIFCF